MKKTMSKKIVAIMVCTAALAGIYGGPVYAESLYKGNLSDIVYVKGGSTGFPRITDLDVVLLQTHCLLPALQLLVA